MKKGVLLRKLLSIFGVLVLLFSLFSFSVMAVDETTSTEDTTSAQSESTTAEETTTDSTEVDTAFNAVRTYQWLHNQSQYVTDVPILSMSILALAMGSTERIGDLVTNLRSLGESTDTIQCWPKGDCNVKDTSYALLAMWVTKQDITKGLNWLNTTLKDGVFAGNPGWQLVLESQSNGTCKVGLEGSEKDYTLTQNVINSINKFYISEGELGGFSGKILPKINVDCSAGLPSGAGLIVSLNYKDDDVIYIVDSSDLSKGTITVPNTCFPTTSGGACVYDSSLIATWALAELGEDLEAYGSYFYLETGINENDNKNLAFLTRTLQRAASSGNTLISGYYLSSLAIKSQSNGAWGNSVYESALSVIALRTASDYAQQVSAGKDYIKSQWLPADNWDESIEATSWSLLALNDYERLKQVTIPITTPDGNPITDDGGAVEICFNGVDDDLDTLIDCNDEVDCANTNYCKYCTNGIFDEDFEEQTDCGKVCPACGDGNGTKLSSEFGIYCTDTIDNDGDMVTDCADSDCASNQACLVDVDNRESECTSDMDCGVNEICTNGACVSSSDQQTTDQGGSSAGLIIILVILILLVIGGGVLFYIKFIKTGKISFGKKSSKPTTSFNSYTSSRPLPSGPIIPQARQPAAPARPIMPSRPLPRPITPVSKPVSKEDDELEQSLKKAEKLLYGDKK